MKTPFSTDEYLEYEPFVFRSLNQDHLARLHEASLEIMQKTGMRFHDQEAIDLFKKAGADISDGNQIRIPAHLVEWALGTAPKHIPIFDRNGREVMSLGGYRSYFGVGSDCMNTYDLKTGKHRKAVLNDVINGVRLVDALPNFDFIMSMFLPSDISEMEYECHQMAVMLKESTKPIVFVGVKAESTIMAVEMAVSVAQGLESLKQKPFIINYVNTVSSFQHNQESVQRLLYAAERNLPTIYFPGAMRGMTTPMTPVGAMALTNAGQLAGMVLSQIKREGSPFIRSCPTGGTMDMRTMVSLYAAPDGGPFGWDLAHYYGIPTFANACSDSKVFDGQAAAETALTMLTQTLNGANLIHDCGYLDSAMINSLELVCFCNDIIGWIRQYLRNFEINDETLALDIIHEVGPDGYFLDTEHTLDHVGKDWKPTLSDRLDYDRWVDSGSPTLQQRANQKVCKIIQNHRAASLPKSILKKIDGIIARQ